MSISRIRDLDNANFGILNASKNGQVISYNHSTNSFVLMSADVCLEQTVADNDLPDDFMNTMENEISLDNVKFNGVDGGSFV
jgi:hypothetical protein